MADWIEPQWPAPAGIRAVFTRRGGGHSQAPYDSLNLALHVGDDPADVRANRTSLMQELNLPGEPFWLQQVHGTRVLEPDETMPKPPEADAVWTDQPGKVGVIMVADCLPVLLCDAQGRAVAAVHAGWRGLCEGVVENTVNRFAKAGMDSMELLAWLGPCIGPQSFEVGPEVRQAFMSRGDSPQHFRSGDGDRYLADLQGLARARLQRLGVSAIFAQEDCTVSSPEHYFSYRRDGQTGRMAALIWLESGR